MSEIREIHQYCKGDAPTVRIGYLRGVILQDNEFISNGHCFFIRPDDEIPEYSDSLISISDIFVDNGDIEEKKYCISEIKEVVVDE